MADFSFGKVVSLSYEDALERIPDELKKRGFGVLTENDVKSTLKEKLGVEFKKYKILGACNPNLAHQILEAEPEAGALLPCNVLVYENDSNETVVSILDPMKMFSLTSVTGMEHVAAEARQLLTEFLDSLP